MVPECHRTLHPYLHVKLGPDKRVIRGAGGAPGLDIDFNGAACFGHGLRRQNVVEPPTFVALERARPQVVPEGELLFIRIKMAEDIDEAPLDSALVRASH